MPDRPGALAAFALRCGGAGVNILGLQIFPGGDQVVDEFILETPSGWSPVEVRALAEAAGGTAVVVQNATKAALVDQPTRYAEAARAIIARPMAYPEILAELFDADPEPIVTAGDVLETVVADVVVQVHREAPFTAVERARGGALAALVSDVLGSRPEAPSVPVGAEPEYVAEDSVVCAWIGGAVVGSVIVEPRVNDPEAHVRPLRLSVEDVWQRRGIGRRLLVEGARLARSLGADEILLTTHAGNQAVLPMVLAAGVRGRIRMAGEQLTVRVPVKEFGRPSAQ
jgi:GNAT superfamily N-acetyltransferase